MHDRESLAIHSAAWTCATKQTEKQKEVHRTYIGCTVENRLNVAGQQGGSATVASVPRICVVALRVVTPKKSCEVNHRARPPVMFTFTMDGDPRYT